MKRKTEKKYNLVLFVFSTLNILSLTFNSYSCLSQGNFFSCSLLVFNFWASEDSTEVPYFKPSSKLGMPYLLTSLGKTLSVPV